MQAEQILQERYKLKKQLGQNAGRQTWLATDIGTSPPSTVIVKLLAFNPQMHWDELKLFEREAQVLKNLNHSRIPQYQDYFSLASLPSLLDSSSKAKQAEAKNTITIMNRGQQAYFLENEKVTDYLSDLGIGIKPETENYRLITPVWVFDRCDRTEGDGIVLMLTGKGGFCTNGNP